MCARGWKRKMNMCILNGSDERKKFSPFGGVLSHEPPSELKPTQISVAVVPAEPAASVPMISATWIPCKDRKENNNM